MPHEARQKLRQRPDISCGQRLHARQRLRKVRSSSVHRWHDSRWICRRASPQPRKLGQAGQECSGCLCPRTIWHRCTVLLLVLLCALALQLRSNERGNAAERGPLASHKERHQKAIRRHDAVRAGAQLQHLRAAVVGRKQAQQCTRRLRGGIQALRGRAEVLQCRCREQRLLSKATNAVQLRAMSSCQRRACCAAAV